MAEVAKPCVIIGSARSDGQTREAVKLAFPGESVNAVILADKFIRHQGSGLLGGEDDFLSVIHEMHLTSTIVFATPVYWYAMAARLKVLYDRFYDLTGSSSGRKLAGKDVWLIATGAEPGMPDGFEIPFRKTADYFSMQYKGSFYLYTGREQNLREAGNLALTDFGKIILNTGNAVCSILSS